MIDVMAVAFDEMFICSKIGTKSFEDESQDICKDAEINLGPVAGFQLLKLFRSFVT